MPINVSQAISADTAEKIIIKRYPAGSYIAGIWTPAGSPTSIKALASVQQPTPKQLEILPEGMRSNDIKLFISNKKIKTVSEDDQTIPDDVVYNGNEYRCWSSGDWSSYGHHIVLGIKR